MQRPIWRLGAALVVALGIVAACGGETPDPEDPELLITATPRQINDQGQISQIDVTARNSDSTAGTGTVTLKASAGAFSSGATEETVTLASGKASASFLCNKGADPKCAGNVRIDGTWGTTTGSTTLTVGTGGTTDGGRDAGSTDGGRDAGPTDGGRDAGPTDGGPTDGGPTDGGVGTFRVVVETSKPQLVANTGDQAVVTATVTEINGGAAVPGVQVTFNTTLGSFTPTAGTQAAQATTDASGKAQVSLYVANMGPGKAQITATHEDGTGQKELTFTAVSSISYVTGSAKALLGIASSGRETTSPISFKVLNSSQQPVPDIEVTFTASGAGGASVTPTGVTNAQGIATGTLRSGDQVGLVIVKATISATVGSTPEVSTSHSGTPIVGGKPSDKGLQVDCAKKNLGALHATPPPRVLNTTCTAKLVDRFGNPVGLATSVQWYPEAGSISSPVDSKPQAGATPAADTGLATTIFNTAGSFPPYAVTPWPGERFEGSASDPADRNPRDMAVTVIAVVAGEEEFADGSGTGPTSGQRNGRWDPGEWFVDLGEPLVDRNDNGVWDSGEEFIDTERIDCANPTAPRSRNNRWDGPNGCWDSETQLWRAIHLVYTGALVQDFTLSPAQPPGGYLVGVNEIIDVDFHWSDAYFNRMSTDGASFTVSKTGTRGKATLVAGAPSAFAYGGFAIEQRTLEGTTLTDGGIALGPNCDTGKATPDAGSETSPVLTRCVRINEFSFLPGGNPGTIRLEGATTQQPKLPDGGVPPPVPGIITIRANHSFSAPTSENFNAQYE